MSIKTNKPSRIYNNVVFEIPSIFLSFENKDFTLAKVDCILYLKSATTALRFKVRKPFLLVWAAYTVSNRVAKMGAIALGVDAAAAGVFSTVDGTSVEVNAITNILRLSETKLGNQRIFKKDDFNPIRTLDCMGLPCSKPHT